tara:strand:- start:15796 stop:15981 length:186 start_codon:yes stop_codon:yes gene_type:complete
MPKNTKRLTKESHNNALKVVNSLYIKAIADGNDSMVSQWGAERNRILSVLTTWKDNNNDES